MILESTIEGWRFKNILLEAHCLAPNLVASLPPHSHEEYQINLAINDPGEYLYRGAFYPVPPASVSVLHPDEVHSGSDIGVRDTPSLFRVLYIPPSLMQQVAEDLTGCKTGFPFVSNPVIFDKQLFDCFLKFHAATKSSALLLTQESLCLLALTSLIQKHTEKSLEARPVGKERRVVEQVRQYLHDRLMENVSLDELAQVAELSPSHLCRVFKKEIGLPPHTYQIRLRISRAKFLLTQGLSPCETALLCWVFTIKAISVGTLNVLWELLLQNISSRRNYRPSKSKS